MNAPAKPATGADPAAVRAAVIECVLTIAPEADFATVRPDRPLRDQLDIDSFDFLNLLIAIRARLGVEVPEADYAQVATLDTMVAYLMRRLVPPT